MQHLPIAMEVGWSQDEIFAIESGDLAVFDECHAALMSFVDECVRDVKVSSQTYRTLAGYLSEGELAEATLLIGHYMMTARFLETLEIDLDAGATSWDEKSLLSK